MGVGERNGIRHALFWRLPPPFCAAKRSLCEANRTVREASRAIGKQTRFAGKQTGHNKEET